MKGAIARLVQQFFHLFGVWRLKSQYLFAYLLLAALALTNLGIVLSLAEGQHPALTHTRQAGALASELPAAWLAQEDRQQARSLLEDLRGHVDRLAGRNGNRALVDKERHEPRLGRLAEKERALREAFSAATPTATAKQRSRILTAAADLAATSRGLARSLRQEFRSHAQRLTALAVVVAMGILLLIILGRLFGTTYLMGRVEYLRKHLLDVSRGDLSQSLPIRDAERHNEIGQIFSAFNTMRDTQVDALGGIREQARRAGTDSEDLSLNADRISTNAQASSQGVEQVSGSIQEVNNVVQDVANNIQEVSASASQTTQTTRQGQESVSRASEQINQLHQASQRVEELMATIENIAKKTDLLALNAAIEAANAGEAGQGFAVVADEVRKLAEQTGNATGQVKEIVADLQQQSDASVQAMDEVRSGMDDILESIQQTDETANQIAAAAEELAATMSETADNVATISTNVDELASSVNLIQEASQQLGNLGFSLERTVKQFRLSPEEPESGADQGALDFGQAKIDHFAWKTALRKLLHGDKAMDETEATSHEHCRLGKWIYGQGLQQFGGYQEMKDLEAVHKQLHQSVHRVIELYNQGESHQAQQEYNRFEELSGQVVQLLDDLKARASGGNSAA